MNLFGLFCNRHKLESRAWRGCLIEFRCTDKGRILCGWKAIYHEKNLAHAFGRRHMGVFQISDSLPVDKITRINHGILIEREADEALGLL